MTPDQTHDDPTSGDTVPGAPAQGRPAQGGSRTGDATSGSTPSGGARSGSQPLTGATSGATTPGGPAPANPVDGGPPGGRTATTAIPGGTPQGNRVDRPIQASPTTGGATRIDPAQGGGPTGYRPGFGSAPAGGAAPENRLPPESRAARSLTDRSKVEDVPGDEAHPGSDSHRGPRLWPRVVGVGILLLAAGGAWIWQNPGFIQRSTASLFPGFAGHDSDAAATQSLEARVTRLEQQPAPDLTALTQRLDALEQRLPPDPRAAQQPPVDLHPLLARLDALEARVKAIPAAAQPTTSGTSVPSPRSPTDQSRPTLVPIEPDLTPLYARLDALEQTVADRTVNPARVAALTSQVEELSSHDPAIEFRGRLDQLEHQLSGLTTSDAKLTAGSDQIARLARLDAAEIALASGHPLGAIPNAPPALARFATIAPPTQAALRLAFPAAAAAALRVSQPDTEGKSFLDGIIARLQDFRLITVRQGDRVLVGNATAATLAHAQVLLEAGDLAGAAREAATLTGPPAEKMAPWLADANALVAAREALASLAEQG